MHTTNFFYRLKFYHFEIEVNYSCQDTILSDYYQEQGKMIIAY